MVRDDVAFAGPRLNISAGYLLNAVLLALLIGFASVSSSAGLLLFALCPVAYLTLPIRPAHGFVVLYSLTPTISYFVRTGDWHLTLTMYLPLGIGSMAVAVFAAQLFLRTRALTRELATVQERQRLAGEIHDTVAQGLSSVVMLLEAALVADPATARKHIELAIETARENMHEARALVGALTPAPLADTSLTDALQRLATRAQSCFAVAGEPRALPTAIEVVLLRVAQESLSNAARHASASRVEVTLEFAKDVVALEIRDDGVGFSPGEAGTGYGLDGMRGRVEQTGGRLTVHSGQSGTVVRAEVRA